MTGPPGILSSPAPSAVELERRAYRKRQGGKSVLLSLLSTLVVAALVWVALLNTPGWAVVQQTFFNGEVFLASLPRVWEGFLLNLRVLAMASVLVLLVALLLATIRTLRGPIWLPLRVFAAAYTDLFRGVPLIIVLYLVGFGIPGLGLIPVRVPAEVWGTVALTLTYSAYVSEVFRAGIEDFVALQKDVGLISILGAVDAVRAAQIETARFFNFTPYVVAGLLFVLLAIPTIRLTDWYTARVRAREQVGGIV